LSLMIAFNKRVAVFRKTLTVFLKMTEN